MPGPVAVLGAGGIMGFPMARNMARAGIEVRAWNRSRDKADPLGDDGVAVVDTPADAVRGAEVVVTILADTDAVLASIEQGLADEPFVWAQMSTVGVDGTERCAHLAAEHDLTFVDAPVLGTKAPAEQGELIVLASGPDDARAAVEPVFEAVGKKVMWVGEAGAGTRLKLVTNNWILAVVEGTAETIALAEGLDVDPRQFLETLSGGPLDLPYLQMKGKAIIEREFEPSFRLALAAKDARLVEDAAERHGLDLPLVRTIRERMERGIPEHGDEDMSATYWTSAPA
jgi:3-hydroxyisobutyrate dehydrogenase